MDGNEMRIKGYGYGHGTDLGSEFSLMTVAYNSCI